MKHLLLGLLLIVEVGCANHSRKATPFLTESPDIYSPKKADMIRLRIRAGDYDGLTLLVVLSPRPLKAGFDLQDCGNMNIVSGLKMEESRRELCEYHLNFLSTIAKMRLEFSPWRFDVRIGDEERRILADKKAVGIVYIKRTTTAVVAGGFDNRHDVSEKMETWFLPFIEGLECNWGGINVEQWAKPNRDKTRKEVGLANIDMRKEAATIDASLVAGYTFSKNYRYNILDHFPHLDFTVR